MLPQSSVIFGGMLVVLCVRLCVCFVVVKQSSTRCRRLPHACYTNIFQFQLHVRAGDLRAAAAQERRAHVEPCRVPTARGLRPCGVTVQFHGHWWEFVLGARVDG